MHCALCIFIACTSDDGTSGGKTPLTLTASGISAPETTTTTRATVDGTWEKGMRIDVNIGDNTYKYTPVSASDGKTEAKLTIYGGSKIYYEDVNGQLIRAWTPSGTEWGTYVTNQSDESNYKACDLLKANATITQPNLALEFKHQTAKIHITLKDAVGNDYNPSSSAKFNPTITIYDMPITPYKPGEKYEYFALAKGTSEARPFKVQFTPEDTELVFDGGNRTFEAGKQYDFELRVGKEGLILSGCTIKGWDEKTGGELNRIDYEVIDGVYHVYTEAGLWAWAEAVKTDKTIYCTLESDITMPTLADGEESNWTAIGDGYNPYTGTFDGNGHTISNLIVSGDGHQGFIGKLSGGTVKNLTLKNVSVTATSSDAGAVAGYSRGEGSMIYGCQVIGGFVTGASFVGGIAGYANKSSIYACSAKCDVTGDKYVGGIAGRLEDAATIACWTNCTITCNNTDKGAIAGFYNSSTATDCYYIKNNGVTDTKGTEKTDDRWNDPIEAMNAAIKDMEHDYVWDRNHDGATNNKVPLVLVKK